MSSFKTWNRNPLAESTRYEAINSLGEGTYSYLIKIDSLVEIIGVGLMQEHSVRCTMLETSTQVGGFLYFKNSV